MVAHFNIEFQRFGDYILLDRINVGGMAEVFRGKQIGVQGFARLVALKFFRIFLRTGLH